MLAKKATTRQQDFVEEFETPQKPKRLKLAFNISIATSERSREFEK
jgi:hypothetical protein